MSSEDHDEEFIFTETGDVAAHHTDDEAIWGLLDVAQARRPLTPTTVYKVAGDSTSGVCGRLTPDGTFFPIHSSRIGCAFVVGLLHDVRPVVGEPRKTLVTTWDGASPAREFRDHDGVYRKEHSRGALLGDYGIHRDIDRGAVSTRNAAKYHKLWQKNLAGGVSPQGVFHQPDTHAEAA